MLLIASGDEVLRHDNRHRNQRVIRRMNAFAPPHRDTDVATVHSGQSWSLNVCRLLSEWLSGDPERKIHFYAVPSKEKWPFHTQVHDYVTNYPRIAYGVRCNSTLDRLRKDVVEEIHNDWQPHEPESAKTRHM